MRTVTYGAACSLDGFIAAADGGVEWLHWSRDVQEVMTSYWATIDTLLMGRKTWEIAAGQPGTLPTYLCSRTLPAIEQADVHLVRGDAGGFVRDLKGQPGKGICLMGGS